MVGFEPGNNDLHSNHAWTRIGTCQGTLTPTASPVYEALQDLGGCPKAYGEGNWVEEDFFYEAGDVVSKNGLVFECREWPFST